MIEIYKTITQPYETTSIEKKSKFICILLPIANEEEAKIHLEAIKKEHYNASHHCIAYRLRTEMVLERYSDDGEPSGTAGMPMLEVLRGHQLYNVMAVVIRYFGGTLLGTGGLARAYTESIQKAITEADIIEKKLVLKIAILVSYTVSGKVEYIIHQNNIEVDETIYGEQVTYRVYIPLKDQERIINEITDATSGLCSVETSGQYYIYKQGQVIVSELV